MQLLWTTVFCLLSALLSCSPRPTIPPAANSRVIAVIEPAHQAIFTYRGYLKVPIAVMPVLRGHFVPAALIQRLGEGLHDATPCFHGSGCSSFSRGEFQITDAVILFDTGTGRRYYMARKLPGEPTILFGLLSVKLTETKVTSGPLSCLEVPSYDRLYDEMLRDLQTWPTGPTVIDYLREEQLAQHTF